MRESAESGGVDGPGARAFLPQDGAWVQVTSIDLSSARDTSHNTTEAYEGEFLLRGGDQAATASLREPVTALASSAKVYPTWEGRGRQLPISCSTRSP